MFTIIGADGREYGPVPPDQIKAWMKAGRVNGETRTRREGEAEWRPLAEYPEFAERPAPEVASPVPTRATSRGPVDPQAYAADLLARAPKLLIGDTIGRSWELLKSDFWPLVGATAAVTVVQAALNAIPVAGIFSSFLLTGLFLGGLYFYYLRRLRREPVELSDAFAGFVLAPMPLLVGGLVSSLLTCVGLLLLVLPGIYLSVAWSFTFLLIIDKKLDFWVAMEVSRRVITPQWWRMLGLVLLSALLGASGILALFVGVFFTLPIAIGSMVIAYETLCNPPA